MWITERGSHGRVAMCLPVPAIKHGEEIYEQFDLRIIEQRCYGRLLFARHIDIAQRFAMRRYGGVPPRTPANFRLRETRFAGYIVEKFRCDGRASRWLSASCHWRCRPSQPRIGFANRQPGFWSDRTLLAHDF